MNFAAHIHFLFRLLFLIVNWFWSSLNELADWIQVFRLFLNLFSDGLFDDTLSEGVLREYYVASFSFFAFLDRI